MRGASLILLFAAIAPLHVTTKLIRGRSGWPTRFLAAAARAVGVRVEVVGEPLRPHSLLISNHLSWLDILILGGSVGSSFVAKDDLGHGLLHWLADQNSTVYVRREHRKGVIGQTASIARALEGDKPVTLFPESTTGPGTHLLPFRSTLLEAAAVAERQVDVRPVVLDYGAAAPEIAWFEEGGMDNVKRVLGRRGTLSVIIHLLPPLAHSGDRKALAQAARDAIAETLASSPGATAL